MTKYKFVGVVGLIAVLLLAYGCGKRTEEGADKKAGSSKRHFLSVGTAPPGGAFFVVGSAIAEVVGDGEREHLAGILLHEGGE